MILNYILIENCIFCNVTGAIRDSGRRTWGRSGIGRGWGKIFEKEMYLVGSTSIGQKSGPSVNRVFKLSISRIMTFWAQIWIRLDITFPMVKKYLNISEMAQSYGQITGFSKRAILNKQHSRSFSDSCVWTTNSSYLFVVVGRIL